MTPILSGLTLVAIALAVILSAFIRLLQTAQLQAQVSAGFAGVRELAELSGITDPRELQDTFGPPGMERIWRHVTLDTIRAHRRLPGLLMSDRRLHWACIGAGLIAFVWPHWSVQLGVVCALLAQIGGWMAALQLPK